MRQICALTGRRKTHHFDWREVLGSRQELPSRIPRKTCQLATPVRLSDARIGLVYRPSRLWRTRAGRLQGTAG